MLVRIGVRAAVFAASALAASILVFFVLAILPGDPARVALGFGATDEGVAQLREQMGLNRPLITQYLDWIGGVVTGDFGLSFSSKQPIGPQLLDRFSVTLWLVLGGIAVALMIALPLGVVAAIRHRRLSGVLISGISQIGVAVPAFLVGMLLTALLALKLNWLPAGGYVVPATDFGGFVQHMILPWVSLGLVQGAVLTRYVRSAVLDEMEADYLRTARAKGMRPLQALVRHGLRNAAIPVVTVLGVQLVTLMVGAVVIERVFTIHGIGSMLTDAASTRDLMTVQGVVLVLVLFALAVSFVVDVLYTVIDPRLRAS